MGLNFLIEEGYYLHSKRKKQVITVTAPVCQLKGRFTFLDTWKGSF